MSEDDLRYTRIGWIDRGRRSDLLARRITELLPGDGVLPSRWTYVRQEAFTKKHGGLGHILWSKAASSFTLLIGGTYVMRIWLDRNNYLCIDVSDTLAGQLANLGITVYPITAGNAKKCKPFVKHISAYTNEDVELLVQLVKGQFGI